MKILFFIHGVSGQFHSITLFNTFNLLHRNAADNCICSYIFCHHCSGCIVCYEVVQLCSRTYGLPWLNAICPGNGRRVKLKCFYS